VLFAAVEAVLLVTLLAMRHDWPPPPAPGPETVGPPARGGVATLGILLFFVYTGLEVTAGQWAFTVLVEGDRGMATATAGLWVASYWGAITVGRLALSAVATRVGPDRILAFSMAGSVVGAALFWWDPGVGPGDGGLGVLGLPLLGISLAGVFPTLVTLTPVRVGALAATRMIGYQLAAASVGAAVLPWITGRILESQGLDTLGALLVIAAAAMAGLHIALDRMARSHPTATPAEPPSP
jgi:fucose permease